MTASPGGGLEAWLRGPIEGVEPLLQPVAHALIQAREEVQAMMEGFPDAALWDRPAGLASAGFHLQHLAGFMDRLLTYARGEALTPVQLDALRAEGIESEGITSPGLAEAFGEAVEMALAQVRATPQASLTEPRPVGRAQLPSTVIGLLVHAAEHTQRHVGQLLVTVAVVRSDLRP